MGNAPASAEGSIKAALQAGQIANWNNSRKTRGVVSIFSLPERQTWRLATIWEFSRPCHFSEEMIAMPATVDGRGDGRSAQWRRIDGLRNRVVRGRQFSVG